MKTKGIRMKTKKLKRSDMKRIMDRNKKRRRLGMKEIPGSDPLEFEPDYDDTVQERERFEIPWWVEVAAGVFVICLAVAVWFFFQWILEGM